MNRRGFLGVILATACAPAIVRASSLMAIKPTNWIDDLVQAAVKEKMNQLNDALVLARFPVAAFGAATLKVEGGVINYDPVEDFQFRWVRRDQLERLKAVGVRGVIRHDPVTKQERLIDEKSDLALSPFFHRDEDGSVSPVQLPKPRIERA